MADFATDAALTAASNEPSANDLEPTGMDGDNKFQKAISAWRSRQ